MRFWPAVLALASLAGCAPDYSANTYASNAVQQANKVERGVVIGVRPVGVSANGAVGAASGAAAGGAIGSTAPGGPVTSTLGAVSGALIGGLVGVGAEKAAADVTAWEYIVRKPDGELVSVTQQDRRPLRIGQAVLVIAGNQARIVADYTTEPPDPVAKTAAPPPQIPAVPVPVSESPLGPITGSVP